jgi:hypothetical protein
MHRKWEEKAVLAAKKEPTFFSVRNAMLSMLSRGISPGNR